MDQYTPYMDQCITFFNTSLCHVFFMTADTQGKNAKQEGIKPHFSNFPALYIHTVIKVKSLHLLSVCAELPQQHVCKKEEEEEEEEVPTEQQLCSQERSCSLDQPEAELPHVKVEEEEVCIRQDEERLSLKQELDTTPASDEGSRWEPDKNQVLSQNSPKAENQDQEDPGCGNTEELKRTKRNDQMRDYRDDVDERNQPSEKDKNQFVCKVCEKSFSQKYKLTTHMRMHTGEMSCEICGKSYTMSRDLNAHLMSHKGEKPFVCPTCGMGFTRKNRLKLHMRTHTQEKLFLCHTCGKSFTESSVLASHQMTHTGEKPFSCNTCGKRFSRKCDLIPHLRTHTGEKPFLCRTCGKTFSRKCSLTTHMRTHTGEKPFSCQLCGKSFRLYGNMFRHKRLHSREKL
ncbi:zinc finger and SCAN domain-containing protein 2 [Austrofundulus limnaeus]|uniref:Zinc finger and SCAN domain-containing protein 2 n=1 Tax=Austrofundulus limnaeus TaxID=52670 RepID=A0A2I4D2C4_AUSLI|nr:PREDICTED: zinc finger and SCAN domain-containing protein 2-like [Austrofundulus limnaeus]